MEIRTVIQRTIGERSQGGRCQGDASLVQYSNLGIWFTCGLFAPHTQGSGRKA